MSVVPISDNHVTPVNNVAPVQQVGAVNKIQNPIQSNGKGLTLHQKISRIMSEVQYLRKDGRVNFGNTNYGYLSEEKVTTEIRQACIKYGVIIFPIEAHPEKIGQLVQVTMKYKIVDVDTGDYEILSTIGHGADSQDKGAGKAMTNAYKYMQRHTFAIPSGDDPDKICSEQMDNDPNNKKYTDEQLGQIAALIKTLQWTKEQAGQFAEQTCGISDFTQYSMAMANKLIIALQNLCKQ